MQWAIAGSGKLEKTIFGVTLLEQRSLEGLGALGRLGLEGLLLFMYLAIFSSGLLTIWGAVERFFAEDFGFLFDKTSMCCLCVCISLPLIFAF